jgi:diguanylate cyclase (GGDEF)-like protein
VKRVQPSLRSLDSVITRAASLEDQEVGTNTKQLYRFSTILRSLTIVVFPLGLLLIILFWTVLHVYRRMIDTAQETERQRLATEAVTDSITGLGNHRAFQEQFGQEVGRALRHGHVLSLALLDLDDFKTVNDRHGHAHGDQVLSIIASVLQGGRGEDRAYRLGGDEFAVVLPHTETAAAIVAVERFRREVGKQLFGSTVSIGVAELSKPDADAETLREQADAALYEAKRRGRNTIASFAQIREHASVVSSAKITQVRRLLAERNLTIAFQPVWDLSRDRPFGYEALMRPASTYQFEGPQEVFDIAERLGRAPELDAVCHEASSLVPMSFRSITCCSSICPRSPSIMTFFRIRRSSPL